MANSETRRVRPDWVDIETANQASTGDPVMLTAARRRRAHRTALVALLLTGGVVLAACGASSSTQSRTPGAKVAHRTPVTPTRPVDRATFIGHAGSAFGAFHRYVYVPFRSGSLHNPAHQRLAAAQAGAAMAAATHDITLAKQAAVSSTALRKLFGPLAALEPTLRSLAATLHRGHISAAAIRAANGEIAGVEQIGSAAGVRILERVPVLKP